jgi:hypothetical protein
MLLVHADASAKKAMLNIAANVESALGFRMKMPTMLIRLLLGILATNSEEAQCK